jgi:hypothetical protein
LQVTNKDYTLAVLQTFSDSFYAQQKKKKYFLENTCAFKKKLYFCTRFGTLVTGQGIRQVHRHIGLTALTAAML